MKRKWQVNIVNHEESVLIVFRVQKSTMEKAKMIFRQERFPMSTATRLFLLNASKKKTFPFEMPCQNHLYEKNLTAVSSIRISKSDRNQVKEAFSEMGVPVSEAVRQFYLQVIAKGYLPLAWLG